MSSHCPKGWRSHCADIAVKDGGIDCPLNWLDQMCVVVEAWVEIVTGIVENQTPLVVCGIVVAEWEEGLLKDRVQGVPYSVLDIDGMLAHFLSGSV